MACGTWHVAVTTPRGLASEIDHTLLTLGWSSVTVQMLEVTWMFVLVVVLPLQQGCDILPAGESEASPVVRGGLAPLGHVVMH